MFDDNNDINMGDFLSEAIRDMYKTKEVLIIPNVLDKTKVEVYNGNKIEEYTILTVDAATDLKIMNSSTIDGKIDFYKYCRQIIKYKVEEVEDVDSFLEKNVLDHIMNIVEKVEEVNKAYGELKLI